MACGVKPLRLSMELYRQAVRDAPERGSGPWISHRDADGLAAAILALALAAQGTRSPSGEEPRNTRVRVLTIDTHSDSTFAASAAGSDYARRLVAQQTCRECGTAASMKPSSSSMSRGSRSRRRVPGTPYRLAVGEVRRSALAERSGFRRRGSRWRGRRAT